MSESSGWTRRSIEQNAYLRGRIGWQGLRADEFGHEGPYLVTGTDFSRGRVDWTKSYHVSDERYQEAAPIQLRDDDLLITKDGTIGKIAHVQDCPEKAVLNSGIFVLRCSDGSFRHRFLYHLLTSHHFDDFLRENLAGSTINHLYQYIFEKFSFIVPDDAHQSKICRIFDLLDTQIEATEGLLAKQERVQAGLMQDLFTRGVDELGQRRPPRDQAPHLYHQTQLGWLPLGWEVKRIGDSAASTILGTARRGVLSGDDQVPLIKMGNLKWGYFELGDVEQLSSKFALIDKRHILVDGDFLFNTRNTPELVGKSAVYHSEFALAVFDNNLLRIKFKGEIDSDFVCSYMNFGVGKQAVNALATGTTSVAAVYWSGLKNYAFPHPAKSSEAVAIVSRLRAATLSQELLLAEAAKLRLQKSGLMQDLLTGKISVAPLLESGVLEGVGE